MSLSAGAAVFTSDQRKHRLGPLLKSGGAGSIYPIVDAPDRVAKVYHDSSDRAQYERKLAAMLELSPHLPDLVEDGRRYVQIAWPQALLRDEHGGFVGFAMPAVDVQSTSELECILQERQARAAGLPVGLGAKVTLAANLAAVIAELHRQGHHVVDLKPVNVRFYPRTLYMAMLDCDGFSIQGRGERFAADQVTPDYLAPEFQSQPIPSAVEQQQDLFALAVVVFQLLNFGIHPFTGRPTNEGVPTDIPGRIAQRCYAYGLRANASLEPSPVSGHLCMPADLRSLFDRAFDGIGAARPEAAEWASTLKAYAQRSNQRLVGCSQDRQHQHFAGLPCAACARASLIAATARYASAARTALPVQGRSQTPAPGRVLAQSTHRVFAMPNHPLQPQTSSAPVRWLYQGSAARPQVVVPHNIATPRASGKDRFLKLLVVLVALALRLSPVWLDHLNAKRDAQITMVTPFRHPPPVASLPVAQPTTLQEVMNADTRMVVRAALSGDPSDLSNTMNRLRRFSSEHPGYVRDDPESAFIDGLTELGNGNRASACDAFVRAIVANPQDFRAWYGLGVAARFDDDATGAWAVVEFLNPGTLDVARSENYWTATYHSPGIDVTELANRQARAKQIADRLRGR